MQRINAAVTLDVTVYDTLALWRYARNLGADNALSTVEMDDMLGTEDHPDLSACLRMVFDPGMSPPGVQIEDSGVNYADD